MSSGWIDTWELYLWYPPTNYWKQELCWNEQEMNPDECLEHLNQKYFPTLTMWLLLEDEPKRYSCGTPVTYQLHFVLHQFFAYCTFLLFLQQRLIWPHRPRVTTGTDSRPAVSSMSVCLLASKQLPVWACYILLGRSELDWMKVVLSLLTRSAVWATRRWCWVCPSSESKPTEITEWWRFPCLSSSVRSHQFRLLFFFILF